MRITILIIACILVGLQGCTKELYYEDSRTSFYKNLHIQSYNDTIIICLNYNIQLGFKSYQNPWDTAQTGADSEQIQNIVNVIKRFNPDIIALQEVPRNRYNTVIKNVTEELAERLDMNYAFGAHGPDDPSGIYPVHGEWGNAILTKYQILGIHNVEVSNIDDRRTRYMLDAKIRINNSVLINSITLHYGLTLTELNEGIENTKEYFGKLDNPIILIADFNYQRPIYLLEAEFTELDLMDADTAYLLGDDRILMSKDFFSPVEVGSYYDSINYTSDHAAVYCILKIND
jgi:endonuclease/exonuclease/phosphatase family metal-dependent hydrolase